MQYIDDNTTTFSIRGRFNRTWSKTGSQILSYVQSLNYNSAFLVPYTTEPYAYQIIPCNISGDKLYMYSSVNAAGETAGAVIDTYYGNYIWATENGFESMSGVTMSSVTAYSHTYRTIFSSVPSSYPFTIISSLTFSEVWLNDENVTPQTYTWSSVPAISGKNGILLPMSTLNDINDGNEVTTSDTSKFNLNDSSNIKNLVDAVVNDF